MRVESRPTTSERAEDSPLDREIETGKGWARALRLYNVMEFVSIVPGLGDGLRVWYGERLLFYLLYIGAISAEEHRALLADLAGKAMIEAAVEGIVKGLPGHLLGELFDIGKIMDVLEVEPHSADQEIRLGRYRFKEAASLSTANKQLYRRNSGDSAETQSLVNENGGLNLVMQESVAIHVIVDRVYEGSRLRKSDQ